MGFFLYMRNAIETRKALLESKPDMFVLLLLAGLIFSIPTNLFKTFLVETAYVRGLQVDYLIPKFHLSDIFLITLFFVLIFKAENRKFLTKKIKALQYKPALGVLGILFILFQITSAHPIVSLLFLLRIFILTITCVIVANNTHLLKSQITISAVKITLIFQSLLAWYQYLTQGSLFNYYFFGETNLNAYAGVAQSSLLGVQKILPYGTTAHPNILAGVLTIFTLFLYNNLSKNSKIKHTEILMLMLSVSAILLTQSISALLGLLFGFTFIYFNKKNKISLTLKKISQLFLFLNIFVVFFLFALSSQDMKSSTSISRRNFLNTASLTMLQSAPITGKGLQNFTAYLEENSTNREVVRFIQPVHNILLLILSETGFIGIVLITLVLLPIIKKGKKIQHPEYLLALLPIMVLDHYLLTIQSGLLLFSLTIWLKD